MLGHRVTAFEYEAGASTPSNNVWVYIAYCVSYSLQQARRIFPDLYTVRLFVSLGGKGIMICLLRWVEARTARHAQTSRINTKVGEGMYFVSMVLGALLEIISLPGESTNTSCLFQPRQTYFCTNLERDYFLTSVYMAYHFEGSSLFHVKLCSLPGCMRLFTRGAVSLLREGAPVGGLTFLWANIA